MSLWLDEMLRTGLLWFVFDTYTKINLFNKPESLPKAIIICVHTKDDGIRKESRVWRRYYEVPFIWRTRAAIGTVENPQPTLPRLFSYG